MNKHKLTKLQHHKSLPLKIDACFVHLFCLQGSSDKSGSSFLVFFFSNLNYAVKVFVKILSQDWNFHILKYNYLCATGQLNNIFVCLFALHVRSQIKKASLPLMECCIQRDGTLIIFAKFFWQNLTIFYVTILKNKVSFTLR